MQKYTKFIKKKKKRKKETRQLAKTPLARLVSAFVARNKSRVTTSKKGERRKSASKSMHHRLCVKGLLFFCRGQYRYIESARRAQHFSRDEHARAAALYRHAEIDRRRFFSPSKRRRRATRETPDVNGEQFASRNELREKRDSQRERERDRERRRTRTRFESRGSIDERSVAWAPLFRGVPRRIVSDSGDLYLPAQGRPLFLPIGLIVRGDDGD